MYIYKGVELKFSQGGRNFWTARAKRTRKFPPPGHNFCPLWASFSTFSTQLIQDIIYKFILIKSSGGGELPPFPPPSCTRMCVHLFVRICVHTVALLLMIQTVRLDCFYCGYRQNKLLFSLSQYNIYLWLTGGDEITAACLNIQKFINKKFPYLNLRLSVRCWLVGLSQFSKRAGSYNSMLLVLSENFYLVYV